MNVLQNFDTRSIETSGPEKHPRIRHEPALGVSCEPKEVTSTNHDVLEVLVVERDRENGTANVELVRRLGHTARWAGNGHKGLRMATAKRPDVVLLNIDPASLDGCQVAKHLRVDFPTENILIIGVATTAHKTLRQRCVQAGIDLVIEARIDGEVIEILLLLECVRLNRLLNAELTKRVKNNFRKDDLHDPPDDSGNGWRMLIPMVSPIDSYLVH